MSRSLIVLKFGSSVLRSEADLTRVVHEVYAHRRAGVRVLCVVSITTARQCLSG